MKKIIVSVVFTAVTLIPLCHAREIEADTNMNADKNTKVGVTTSMNGSTSTNTGIPISSTAVSAEGKSTSGGGN